MDCSPTGMSPGKQAAQKAVGLLPAGAKLLQRACPELCALASTSRAGRSDLGSIPGRQATVVALTC